MAYKNEGYEGYGGEQLSDTSSFPAYFPVCIYLPALYASSTAASVTTFDSITLDTAGLFALQWQTQLFLSKAGLRS